MVSNSLFFVLIAGSVCDASHSSDDEMFLLQKHTREKDIIGHQIHTEYIDWDVCNAEIYSNLGGLGGNNLEGTDLTKRELRYKNITTLENGSSMDLVITNTTEYLANPINPDMAADAGESTMGAQWFNGKNGCMARFNIRSPSDVNLKFRMVWTGTDELVGSGYKYDFSIFDFDMSQTGSMEQITVQGIDSWWSLISPVVVGDAYTFNTVYAQVDNPSDPLHLTDAQEAASVALLYSTNEWDVTFRSIDTEMRGAIGGRNFMFAGQSALSCKKDADGSCVETSGKAGSNPRDRRERGRKSRGSKRR